MMWRLGKSLPSPAFAASRRVAAGGGDAATNILIGGAP